jgi:hypothetical protein
MQGIKCNGCGLVNAAADPTCRRCRQDLNLNPMRRGSVDPTSPRPEGASSFPVIPLAIVAIVVIGLGFLMYRSFRAAGEPPKAAIPPILAPPTPTEQEISAQRAEQDALNKLKVATPNPVVNTKTLHDQEMKAIQPALDEMQRKNIERAQRTGKEVERDVAETGIVGH